MNYFETNITMRVVNPSDPDYHYEVHVAPDECVVVYVEQVNNVKKAIYFASAEEMKAVANAMIVATGVMK